jgi:chaperonin cofactor prefoldin
MAWRSVAALAAVVAAVAPLRADDMAEPYRVQVVMQFGAHRLLTPQFRDRLRQELADELKAALGKRDTVTVEELKVEENTPAMWKRVAAEGLGVLDSIPDLSDHKTHFVQIDYADGQYEIAARQHDGSTGLASPLIRREETPDRMVVGRLAAKLIGHDFGVVGVVLDVQGDVARVQLKGGKTGTPLERWVKPKDVFAVAQVKSAAGNRGSANASGRGRLETDTILQVTDKPGADGVVKCRVFTGRKAVPDLNGSRCLELGTTTTVLRLRVVDESGATMTNVQVLAGDGFGDDSSGQQSTELRDGVYVSKASFENAACVRVQAGGVLLARLPLPLLDGQVITQSVRKSTGPTSELTELLQGWRDVVDSINETNQVHNGNMKQLVTLIQERKNRPALDKAKASLEMIKADEQKLTRLVADLITLTSKQPPSIQKQLQPVREQSEQRLEEMRAGERKVEERIGELKNAIEEASSGAAGNKGSQLKFLGTQAKIQMDQGEFEKALGYYDQILKLDPAGQVPVKEAADRLRSDLAKRDREANRFATDVWPKLRTAQEVNAKLDEAKKWVKVCQTKGDKLTLMKLQNVARTSIGAALNDQKKGLKTAENEDDRQTEKQILAVAQELITLDGDITKALAAIGG